LNAAGNYPRVGLPGGRGEEAIDVEAMDGSDSKVA
jgi:hypothetical protein